MKKSMWVTLAVFLAVIPLTIYFGRLLPGRGYYLTATLIIIELMLPFFMAFEGRRPQARELVVVAVMCAIAIVGRVAIPIPNFKAVFGIIMITGIALGPETGFMVGAVTAFGSNFFFGQGAYLPWQMLAYGASGMLAGFVFYKGKLKKNRITMAIFGFLGVVLFVGPLLDLGHLLIVAPEITKEAALAGFGSGFIVNLIQSAATALVMFLFGKPLLEKLDRVRLKYGMTEDDDGV